MICSGFEANWTRLEILLHTAHELFLRTAGSDFRAKEIGGGDFFPFDFGLYEEMRKESALVGAVMVWAVVILESLLNHAIAEHLVGSEVSTVAIENPKSLTAKQLSTISAVSDLGHKMALVVGVADDRLFALRDELAFVRNHILHNKPFYLDDRGEGDVDIRYYRSRNPPYDINPQYHDLGTFSLAVSACTRRS